MSNDLQIGDRVEHPKMPSWGIGQITKMEPPNITIYFAESGEKKLRSDLVELRRVDGDAAVSAILDSKLKPKSRAKRRKFDDPKYFNDGRSASRKQFIENLGATCANWNWSWSFVNHQTKQIFFGAWQDFHKGNRALIFSLDWRTRNGKKRPSWPESRENLRLIEAEGYSLNVYTMILDPDSQSEYESGPRKIGAILNDVTHAELLRVDDDWFAIFPEERLIN